MKTNKYGAQDFVAFKEALFSEACSWERDTKPLLAKVKELYVDYLDWVQWEENMGQPPAAYLQDAEKWFDEAAYDDEYSWEELMEIVFQYDWKGECDE